MTLTWAESVQRDHLRTIAARLEGGSIVVYGGHRPDSPDEVVAAASLVVVAFPPNAKIKNGILSADTFKPAKVAFSGRATFYRCFDRHGEPILDGSVGTQDADLILNSCDLVKGIQFGWTAFKLRAQGVVHADRMTVPLRTGETLVGYAANTAPASVRNAVRQADTELEVAYREHGGFTESAVNRYYAKVGAAFFNLSAQDVAHIHTEDMRSALETLGLKTTADLVN